MFDRCMTDSLCLGMLLMIVVLNSDTPAQFGNVRLRSTAAGGQAAHMSIDLFNSSKKEAPVWALLEWRGSLLLPTAYSERSSFPQ